MSQESSDTREASCPAVAFLVAAMTHELVLLAAFFLVLGLYRAALVWVTKLAKGQWERIELFIPMLAGEIARFMKSTTLTAELVVCFVVAKYVASITPEAWRPLAWLIAFVISIQHFSNKK
jgi:hypothetical protein